MHVKKVYFSSPKALSLLDEGADVALAHGLAPEHGGQVLDDFFYFFNFDISFTDSPLSYNAFLYNEPMA